MTEETSSTPPAEPKRSKKTPWIPLGVAIGAAVGVATGAIAVGIGVGVAIGCVLEGAQRSRS